MVEIKNKIGRPTVYTLGLAKEICDRIASTSKGTKKLCKENKHWPCQDTLFTWLKIYPEFSEQYAQAKRCQIEVFIDEILDIADDSSQDEIANNQGHIVCNSEFIARSRLRIDTRKWLASKLVPKIYGVQQKNANETTPSLIEQLVFDLKI
ncbi:MAG: hypothetical protein CK426_00010 [Legionella sp.]|nr:MAG: hypothetical protein CK426_00010 [Legionella sp.]